LATFVPVALVLGAGFALEVEVLAIVAFLTDFGLVADVVDLAETGARAARGDAEVFEDMVVT
jgi:hypothetical protein